MEGVQTVVKRRASGEGIVKTSLRLPVEVLKALQHQAIDEGVTDTVLVERIVREYLERVGRRRETQ